MGVVQKKKASRMLRSVIFTGIPSLSPFHLSFDRLESIVEVEWTLEVIITLHLVDKLAEITRPKTTAHRQCLPARFLQPFLLLQTEPLDGQSRSPANTPNKEPSRTSEETQVRPHLPSGARDTARPHRTETELVSMVKAREEVIVLEFGR